VERDLERGLCSLGALSALFGSKVDSARPWPPPTVAGEGSPVSPTVIVDAAMGSAPPWLGAMHVLSVHGPCASWVERPVAWTYHRHRLPPRLEATGRGGQDMSRRRPAECAACGHVEGKTLLPKLDDAEAAARVQSADQRAAAMAAIASIAAGLVGSAAAVIVDTGKLVDPTWVRYGFEWGLLLALVSFGLAVLAAARGHRMGSGLPASAAMAKTKHDHVTFSMWCLLAAMICVGAMVVAAMNVTIPVSSNPAAPTAPPTPSALMGN
jgi:hypothetical protein